MTDMRIPITDYTRARILTRLFEDCMTEGNYDLNLAEYKEWCDKYNVKKNLLTYSVSFMLWLGLSLTEYWQTKADGGR